MKTKWLVVSILTVIELALCGTIVGISWASVTQARVDGPNWNVFSDDRVSAEASDEQTFTVSGPASLTLQGLAGKVTVTGGSGDTIQVQTRKVAWGPDAQAAEAELETLRVTMTQAGDALTIIVTEPERVMVAGQTNSVEFIITVPTETAVKVAINFGPVTLSNTVGNADLQTRFGDVNASDVQAPGDITLRTDFGHIEFQGGAANNLAVKTNSGRVTLTDILLSEIAEVHSDFGGITLTEVDASTYSVTTNSGPITIKGARGAVTAHSDFGDVTVTNAEAVTLDLKTNSGAVTFSGSLGDGPHSAVSDFGRVWLTIPADSALTIDLKTDFGKITSALPITADGDLEERWQGTINGGGARLTVKTNSGSITLDILNP